MTEADVTVRITEPGMAIEITESSITVGMKVLSWCDC